MTESEAIARVQGGDSDGLRFLVQQHQVKAIRAAALITGDVALAEDVVQAAFLRFFERALQFDASRPFAPYFLRMVTNAAVRAAQRQGRFVSLDEDALEDPAAPLRALLADPAPGPEAGLARRELREKVWAALAELSPRQRAAIVQRYYLEMSEAVMATALGVAPGTIKWHLHQARARLEGLLQRG